jgi:atypical protein kinase C iota type
MCVHKKCHRLVRRPCTKESLTPLYPDNVPQSVTTTVQTVSISPELSNGERGHNENEVESMENGHHQTRGGEVNRWQVSLDDFQFLTVIGKGSYAKVVQAEHKRTQQIYAVKIIKKQMFNDDEDIDWVQTEKSVFETASNHPFLVGLHSCFQVCRKKVLKFFGWK